MKNEELDSLKAKYWAGKTSLEEERRLKALEEDAYFSALKDPKKEMDWEFETFMNSVDADTEKDNSKVVIPLYKKVLRFSSIAAALIIGFFLIKNMQDKPVADQVEQLSSMEKELPAQTPDTEIVSRDLNQNPQEELPKVETHPTRIAQVKPAKQSTKVKSDRLVASTTVQEEELFVEVNGVRIYDEEKALEVTEAALQLASNNLKQGMKGIEKIKYLHIEI